MAQDKTFGDTLYFSQWGGERPIPDVFIAAMERAEERTSGYAADAEIPQNVKDDVNVVDAFFDTRERRTNEKVLVVVRKKDGNITLRDFRTTDQGLTLQVDSTLFYTTDNTFVRSYPSATQDVAIKDLGNRWSIQEVAVTGTWVNGTFTPGIFQGVELSTRREDPVPQKFRTGLPVTEVQSVEEGTVGVPTLNDDDLSASERQLAEHRKLLSRLTRDGVTLPFSLVSKRTNEKKQVVVVTDTYRVTTTAPSVSALQDVEILDLGDGHEVATTEVVSAVFGNESYTKQIEDLLPARFRGALPTTLTRQILEGTATNPTLSTGDLRRTEEQITALTKLVEVLTRSGTSFPITIVDQATITEYGGGAVTITSTIDTNETFSVDEGEGVVSSKITKLGEGHELKETVSRVAGSWPTRIFARWSGRFRTIVSGTRQVVAKGSTSPALSGSTLTEVEPVDGYREDKIVTTEPYTVIDAYSKVLHCNTSINLPAELLSPITSYMDGVAESGSYNENGYYAIGGAGGAGGVTLQCSAQCAASILSEVSWNIKEPSGQNVPCVQVVFFVTNSTTRSQILTRVGTVAGVSVSEWPKWSPRMVSIKCVGAKKALSLRAQVSAHDSVIADYLGALKTQGSSRTNGAGGNYEVGQNTKVIRIPATIHGSLTLDGVTNNTASAAASCSLLLTSGASVSTGNVGVSANGFTDILNANATSGTSTIPTSGWFLHHLNCEPDPEFDRIRVFAEIVDFANIV